MLNETCKNPGFPERSAGGIDVACEEVHCFVYSRSQFLDWRTWART